VYGLYKLGKKQQQQPLREGMGNKDLHPANIKGAVKKLKDTNTRIEQDMLVGEYKSEYEDYLIELYRYVDLVGLDECVKPHKNINEKMRELSKFDTRYTPLKMMVNESMALLDKINKK
jgi:hypothetical protein